MSDAPYEIRFQSPAKRALSETLPETAAAAAFRVCVGALAENPHRAGGQLREPLDAYRSARRGTYRIVYTINDTTKVVTVEWIGHRSDVYRPR